MATAEVTVRGGGVFGLACAWECARRGARVRLIETAGQLGAGCSGGLVGALAPHVPEQWSALKQFQFESLIAADDFWAAVAAAGGEDAGYARVGRLQPLADAEAVARAEERSAGAALHWAGRAQWRVARCDEFGAFAPQSPTGLLVHDTLSGRANPRQVVAALAAALRARGGEIVLGEAADEGAVIWATGVAGIAQLSQAFGKSMGGGVKGQAALLAHDAGAVPLIYADMLIVPHANGTVAVGSTSERSYANGVETDTQLETLIAKARAICPPLADAPVLARWAGLRPRGAGRGPMLGHWPARAGHFVANGGYRVGFGIAPKVAQVVADLVLDGRDTISDGMRVQDCL
jgi:glycine/D-amino acid oxidase-like deaminating enzyme